MRSLLLVIALCSTAYAQAPGETVETAPPETKSVWAAYGWSVAATTLPIALAAGAGGLVPESHTRTQDALGMIGCAALVVGPSAGHWYLGEGITTGLKLRVLGAMGVGALVIADPHAENIGLLITGGTVAVGLWEVGMIWDMATLPRSVHRYNRHQRELQLAPLTAPHTTGLAVVGTF